MDNLLFFLAGVITVIVSLFIACIIVALNELKTRNDIDRIYKQAEQDNKKIVEKEKNNE